MSKNDDDVALRCSVCGLDWPVSIAYKVCPVCQDPDGTSRVRHTAPMNKEEAQRLKAHADFDRFYEDWDQKQSPDRLLPQDDDVPSVS